MLRPCRCIIAAVQSSSLARLSSSASQGVAIPSDILSKAPLDPEHDSVIVFPGQGTQRVGMGEKLHRYPEVRQMYEIASQILGYNMKKLCLEGPQERLNKTIFSQPAIYVTSIATVFKLFHEKPKAIEQCTGTAGFSVGEISALVFAGAMTFEEGLHLVRVRAEAMQRCCDAVQSGMLTTILDDRSRPTQPLINAALTHCREKHGMESPVLSVASYLYPACRGIAGHVEALEFIQNSGAEFGVKRAIRVPVSGAFHTELMKPASRTVRNCIHRMSIKKPQVPVFFNYNADTASNSSHMSRNVYKQIYLAVRWEQIISRVLTRPEGVPLPRIHEVGPGKQLTTMLQRTNLKAYKRSCNVEA